MPRLQAGDTLRLAPAIYRNGMPLRRLQGIADAPIVITGPEVSVDADGFQRAVLLGATDASQSSSSKGQR